MDIQRLIDMGDDEFSEVVSQAAKARRDFPEWWRQARDPGRYPHARGFAQKMRGLLAEITLERAVREEG